MMHRRFVKPALGILFLFLLGFAQASWGRPSAPLSSEL